MPAGLDWLCIEWTSGKNDSRILRIDTVESAGRPGETQQFLSFLICGSAHSDILGTKSKPQLSPREAGETAQPVASLSGWTPSLVSFCLQNHPMKCARLSGKPPKSPSGKPCNEVWPGGTALRRIWVPGAAH